MTVKQPYQWTIGWVKNRYGEWVPCFYSDTEGQYLDRRPAAPSPS